MNRHRTGSTRSQYKPVLLLLCCALLLAACQEPVCLPDSVTYTNDLETLPAPVLAAAGELSAPLMVDIRGKTIPVDRVIEGPVCNDYWTGTIYVGCNIEIPAWDTDDPPTFFEKCDLVIEPDTVIYVASHNDTAYYKGCSCHTGGEALP